MTAIIKGICIVVFLGALGWTISDWQWWVSAIALNIAVGIKEAGR